MAIFLRFGSVWNRMYHTQYTIALQKKHFVVRLFFLTTLFFHSGLRSSARNIFIASLALADLILCVFNMPLTLILTLTKSWPFYSDSWIFCKSILTLQAVTVFLSSFLITLIALDRRHFILNPSKKQVSTHQHISRNHNHLYRNYT